MEQHHSAIKQAPELAFNLLFYYRGDVVKKKHKCTIAGTCASIWLVLDLAGITIPLAEIIKALTS